jgi:hypothetical protein
LSANILPRGRTDILIYFRMRGINSHPVEGDEDSPPQHLSDTEDRVNWNGDLDNPTDSEDKSTADIESDGKQDNSMDNLEYPEQ